MPLPARSQVVVEARLAGSAATVRLHAAGVDVHVVDTAAHVGGRLATGRIDGFVVDRGFPVLDTGYPRAATPTRQPSTSAGPGRALLTSVTAPQAQPATVPPLRLRQPVGLGGGLHLVGDHRDTPSIQGAMASGARTARAVLRALGTDQRGAT